MKFNSLYYLVAIFSFSLISCEEDKLSSDDCESENLICTEEFRTITLEIKDGNGNPVVLDDFYTFEDSRNKFEFDKNDFQVENGIYPVISDAELEELDKVGTVLIFVGEIDGRNVVEHQMVIGHDCCHVILIEGETEIQIEE
ncbi:hypothetical protein [Marivirga harenae]|uniref:hypothetical protein n=1 Tax=Marivirga harenae TaxID=2010992 RepID=UPI0026E0D6EB|nr:hypothetical protein [Marivirga harenae]WKV10682.1 hypothetical protein Q3Y49_10705 [Marivirga harenae]|tara:strand:+ start:63551 stop:63976 length:426 start_codon:yes stop_codon:yes gene_type:complete